MWTYKKWKMSNDLVISCVEKQIPKTNNFKEERFFWLILLAHGPAGCKTERCGSTKVTKTRHAQRRKWNVELRMKINFSRSFPQWSASIQLWSINELIHECSTFMIQSPSKYMKNWRSTLNMYCKIVLTAPKYISLCKMRKLSKL